MLECFVYIEIYIADDMEDTVQHGDGNILSEDEKQVEVSILSFLRKLVLHFY